MRLGFILPAFAATALTLAAGAAAAQQTAPSVEVTPFTVEGLVVGNKWVIDAAFGAKHNVAVPAPFELIVPRGDDFLVGTEPAPGGTSIMKYHFVTPDKKLIENLQFVPMTIPLGDMEARLKSIAKALSEQAFPSAVAGSQSSKIDVMRKTQIGPYVAVEVIGRYQNEADGLVHLRLVGIPNPERAESVFTIMNLLASRVKLEKLEDFEGTRTGRSLSTFRYR